MNSKTIFVTTLIPDNLSKEIRDKSRNTMVEAANALQWNIYKGMCENSLEGIEIINVLPVGSYPEYYRDWLIRESFFSTSYSHENYNIGFCNIRFLRQFFISNAIYQELIARYRGFDSGTVYVYTIAASVISAINRFKKIKPHIKVCAIVADLPNMSNLSSKKSLVHRLSSRWLSNMAYTRLQCIDMFVLLTKHMASYMKLECPYIVMEGISEKIPNIIDSHKGSKLTIQLAYTGTLHRKFGIMNLVNAFMSIDNNKIELIICGTGDSEDDIFRASAKDKRIKFLGQLSREEALKIQMKADILVNPRQNIEEYTKYSFPSKTMEYLASGKPVIAYKLDGIPNEYDDYIIYVKDNSVESLANTIINVVSMSEEDRHKIGIKGQDFVLNKKNRRVQTMRIMNYMDSI